MAQRGLFGSALAAIGVACQQPVFWIILATDIALILISVILGALAILGSIQSVPDVLQVSNEVGLGSITTYFKWGMAALLFALVARRAGRRGFWAVTITLLIFLTDDLAQGHEQLGGKVAWHTGLHALYGPESWILGEIIVMGSFAAIGLGLMVLAWRGLRAGDRAPFLGVALLVLTLGFFGVGVDAVHALIGQGAVGDLFWGTLEDGGEMVVATGLVALAYGLYQGIAFPGGGDARDMRGGTA